MIKILYLVALGLLGVAVPVAYTAGPFTTKVESGNCSSGDFVEGYSATGTRTCGTPAGGTPANPTATAGPTAINGSASTYMRSDGAPAVQQGTAAQKGIVQVDGTSITASSGVISATGASGANPSATASDTAVNGSASTFMRSDGAPAVQKATSGQFGVVEVDGTSITATSGVISSVGASGANPSATAGPTAVNGSASTFMRSDGAPAVQQGSAAQKGIVQVDGTSITASSGVISATGVSGANPSATASDTAVNGSATTYMRSDGAPAIQKATSGQFGVVEVDGTTITAAGGVISSVGAAGANPSAIAGPTAVNGSASTFMRSDGAPAIQKATSGQFGIVEVDGSTITASAGVISATNTASTGANPSATAGPTAVNGSASTFMRSDGAPAVQQGSSSQKGIVQVDNTTITASSGVISAVSGTAGINQLTGDATAGPAVGSTALTLATVATPGTNLKVTYNAKGLVTSGTTAACADLSNGGTACTATTGTSGATLGLLNASKTDSGDNTFSGTNTFAAVKGNAGNSGTLVSGTTYSFAATDCGSTVVFTSGSAVTATIPASIVPTFPVTCAFAVLQAGAGKVSVNGTAVSAATLVSDNSYTATSGTAGNQIGLTLINVSGTAKAFLSGAGS